MGNTLNLPNLKAVPIPLLPLPEQRRVADILDRADTLRARRRRAVALLELLRIRCFSELMVEGDWPVWSLNDLAATQGGLTVNRKRAGLPHQVDYLRVANVSRGLIDGEIKQIGVSDPELQRVTLQVGDLLVVEGHGNVNEVGRVAQWSGISQMVHQNHLIRVRPNAELLNSTYAESYLNSKQARTYFRAVSKTTSGLNTINMSNVKNVPVRVPPLHVQVRFAETAESVDVICELHRSELVKLDELFASLQHLAFKGEL